MQRVKNCDPLVTHRPYLSALEIRIYINSAVYFTLRYAPYDSLYRSRRSFQCYEAVGYNDMRCRSVISSWYVKRRNRKRRVTREGGATMR